MSFTDGRFPIPSHLKRWPYHGTFLTAGFQGLVNPFPGYFSIFEQFTLFSISPEECTSLMTRVEYTTDFVLHFQAEPTHRWRISGSCIPPSHQINRITRDNCQSAIVMLILDHTDSFRRTPVACARKYSPQSEPRDDNGHRRAFSIRDCNH